MIPLIEAKINEVCAEYHAATQVRAAADSVPTPTPTLATTPTLAPTPTPTLAPTLAPTPTPTLALTTHLSPSPSPQPPTLTLTLTQDLEAHGENYAETLKRLHALLHEFPNPPFTLQALL